MIILLMLQQDVFTCIRGVEVFDSTSANSQGNGTWLEKKDQTYLSEYVDRLTGPEGDRNSSRCNRFS